jgi:hypothetical protein
MAGTEAENPRRAAGLPDFLIIGAQKSASTFLQDQIAQHPSVEILAGESRHFEDPEYLHGGVEALPGLFRSLDPQIVRGIKRPDYLGRPEIPARLAYHIPDARIFVVLRDPVSRAVSAYYHYVRHGFVPLLPLNDVFDQLLAGQLVDDYPRASEILSYGLYGAHLSRYLQHFPAEQFMLLPQDRLIREPAESMRRAFDFIGVDPTFVTQQIQTVSNRGAYHPLRLRILRSKNRFRYSYTDSLDRRTPRRSTPGGWLWSAAVVALDRTILARLDSGRPEALDEQIQGRLRQYYQEDAELLERLLVPESGPVLKLRA